MFNWLRSSLPARAGLAVILIAILALASSLSAGLIAWFSQGDAAAINTAGSVRMETYHLSWKLAAGAPADEIDAIIQAAPTPWIRPPRLDEMLASQIRR